MSPYKQTDQNIDALKRARIRSATNLKELDQELKILHNYVLSDVLPNTELENIHDISSPHYLKHAVKPVAEVLNIHPGLAHCAICYQLQVTGGSENARGRFWLTSSLPGSERVARQIHQQIIIKVVKDHYHPTSFRAFGLKHRNLVLECALAKKWPGNRWNAMCQNEQIRRVVSDPKNRTPKASKDILCVYACDLYEKHVNGQEIIGLP